LSIATLANPPVLLPCADGTMRDAQEIRFIPSGVKKRDSPAENPIAIYETRSARKREHSLAYQSAVVGNNNE
jgi:hypothetical protein